MALETNWPRAKRQLFNSAVSGQLHLAHILSASTSVPHAALYVRNLREPALVKKQAHEGSWECLLSYKDDTKAATLEFMFPSMQLFNTLPTHFLHDREPFPESTSTNQQGCRCARVYIVAKLCGCVSWVKECVLRNQGESFLVSVPAIVCSPWKSMPVVGRQSLLSCLSVLVEKLPPTDRPTVYLRGTSTSENNLPIENTLTLLQGAQLSCTSLDVLYVLTFQGELSSCILPPVGEVKYYM